jgi:hypothetical protein
MNETTRSRKPAPRLETWAVRQPEGRPKGSRNRVTLVALAAMEEGADAIAERWWTWPRKVT